MNNAIDISSTLISNELIRQKLPAIFVDSIVVDQKFNVVVMSQNVLDFLEFSREEVGTKNINYFAGSDDLAARLKNDLSAAHFEELATCLFTKTNRKVNVNISGFYLGLISDINGYIILRVRNQDEIELINHQLRKKKAELDRFIYRTAHDLRGPLATIKGLINLMKIRPNDEEVDRFVMHLDAHANKLDERLFQLVYLAEADQEKVLTQSAIDFSSIETTLRKVMEQNAFVDFLEFHFEAPPVKLEGIDGALISSLLSHTMLYFLSLQMNTTQVRLLFRLWQEDDNLKITIAARGFETTLPMRKAIHESESIYTDVIHYPQLMNFFAAQKVALQLETRLNVRFMGFDNQRVAIQIPLRVQKGK